MFVKEFIMEEERNIRKEGDPVLLTERDHTIECDEYVKHYTRERDKSKAVKLSLRLFKNEECFKELVYTNRNRRVEIFIENNQGDTIRRFKFPEH